MSFSIIRSYLVPSRERSYNEEAVDHFINRDGHGPLAVGNCRRGFAKLIGFAELFPGVSLHGAGPVTSSPSFSVMDRLAGSMARS
jgi:hypothetical protein